MTLKFEAKWPKLIRRYVYELIILYTILGLIAIGYFIWQGSSYNEIKQLSNDYHLASINHFLKAQEEILHIENNLIYVLAKADTDTELHTALLELPHQDNNTTSFYLIQRNILAALKLHQDFTDSRFESLTKKLENQLSNFEKIGKDFFNNGSPSVQVLTSIKGLMLNLKQLERLHAVQRNKLQTRLSVWENYQTKAFFILISIVMLAGFLTTKRVLKAIGKVTSQQIQDEEQIRIFSQAIAQSPVSVMITDTHAKLIYVNRTFERISGYSSAEVIGKNPKMLQSGQTPRHTYNDIWQALTNGKTCECELQNLRKNGETFYESAHFSPVFDESGVISHYLVIKEDITLRKQQEQRILRQAHYDSLTNLPNRFLALDRLTHLLNEAQRKNEKIALLFLDLDDFKKVNDTLGHETGDQLLIEVAERFLKIIRSSDTVGRMGGDEFIILLSELADATDVITVVENVIHQFKEVFKINGRELRLTTSIGIAVFPEDGDNASELLRNADSAMFHAKDMGRNTYSYFTEAMNLKVSRRLALEEQMHGALERGEFHILHQPKVDISSGRIIGAEALLRWHNPVLDQVFPDEFIPIAEQTGLIESLGQFVLTEALSMAAQWQQEYEASFQIAVNLSPCQFRDPDLVSFIENAMQHAKVAAESLELEITEGVLMSGYTNIDNALTSLNNLGIKLAMDDFGTGYSSLSYLRNYPFDTLKIDRTFINDITEDPADRELVNATIAMAHGLGIKVVAEGVETEAQLAHLKTQGCELAQGYLFSKPVSTGQITKLLAKQH